MNLVRSIGFLLPLTLLYACSFSLTSDVTPPPGYRSMAQTTEEAALDANAQTPDPLTPSVFQPDSGAQMESTSASPVMNETQEWGILTGEVVNLSGGELPAGMEIMLSAFDQQQLIYTATTALDEEAVYLFEEVEMREDRAFQTSVEFDGAIYGSDTVIVKDGQTAIELPIGVYETTTELSVLWIDRLHYFFEFLDDKNLRVVEVYVISNPGKKALIASQSDQPVVGFHLPPGASNLELQNGSLGDRYVATADGFGDTLPVPPGMGNYQVMFSYSVPYSSKLDLVWPVTLPIKALVILAPEKGMKVKGNDIQDAGMRDIQGMQYQVYEGSSFSPGEDIKLIITGRPLYARSTLSINSGFDLFLGLGSLAAAWMVVAVWVYRKNRTEKPKMDETLEKQDQSVVENPETLMDAILALDDLYQGGSLPEEAYLQRRAELKSRLKRMMGS